MYENKLIGALGEQFAVKYLEDKGFQIVECNANSRWGELDIVTIKNNVIIFVEVKTRKSTRQGKPYEAVQNFKIKHLMRTVQYYIKSKDLRKYKFRIDVISIILNQDNSVKELKHYENLDTQY